VEHTLTIEVRHYECDAYDHVNNANYLNYLEFARERFLRDAGLDYPGWIKSGNGIFVSEAHLKYLHPATAGEQLTVVSSPCEAGGAWIVLEQNIFSGTRAVLESQVKLVWVNALGRPTRIPADWRQRFLEGTLLD